MSDRQGLDDGSMESLVAQVTDEFMTRLSAGEQPVVEDYARRYPQLAPVLRQVLPALQLLRPGPEQGRVPFSGPSEAALAGHAIGLETEGTLGDYRIAREIGRGGMGIVYEAVQISLGRRVALKVLPFAAALDPKQLQRFKNEAQAAAQLHHQNIVPVYGVGCERGVHYYAMQFIDGRTLAALIRELRQGDEAVRWWDQEMLAEGAASPPRHSTAPAPGDQKRGRSSFPASEPGVDERARPGPEKSCVPFSGSEKVPDTISGPVLPSAPTLPLAALSTERSAKHPNYFRTVAKLGVQAAEALEHAHGMGIVHRDIKPANLLVDVRGDLWITDFGLARLHNDSGLTGTGDLLGTLRYMSPEQALAKHGLLDQRTDIYSLGATLYELLTLRPVCPGQERQQVLRRLEHEESVPPRRWNPAIPADLETIVLKALAKELPSRYGTAQELADDLKRFLEDKPIQAKRPSPWERARKWVRRHKSVARLAAVFALLMIVGLAVSTWLISRQRDEAERRRRQARDAADTMFADVGEQWLAQEPHLEPLQRIFLRRALEFYQQLSQEHGRDPSVQFGTAKAHRRIGDIQQRLGEYGAATEAYQQAIQLLQDLVKSSPQEPDYRDELAVCHNHRGNLLRSQDRLAEAEYAYRQALTLFARLTDDHPLVDRYRDGLAGSSNNLGMVLYKQGQLEEAEKAFRQALRLYEQLSAEAPEIAAHRRDHAGCLNNLGNLLRDLGHYNQADKAFRQALALWRKLNLEYSWVPVYRQALATTYHSLGQFLVATGAFPEAEKVYRESLLLRTKLADDFPAVLIHREELAASHLALGLLLAGRGRSEEAQDSYRQAIDISQKLATDYPAITGHAWMLGVAHYRAGHWTEAIASLEKSAQDCTTWFYLAMAHWHSGEKEQARKWYELAVNQMDKDKRKEEELRRLRDEAKRLLNVSDHK